MKIKIVPLIIALVISLTLSAVAREWLDEFDGEELNEEWFRITWRPNQEGTVELDDGQLLINGAGNYGHLITDGRPLVLRKGPTGDFSISALVNSDVPPPAEDYWVGLFIIGKDGDSVVLADNYAFIGFGGEKGALKTIIASMVDNTFGGKGQFQVPGWLIYLKLEKIGDQYTGYYKMNAGDEWTKLGQSWTHNMGDPELVGFGFLNNWGAGPDPLMLIADYFLLEGENVIPMAVQPMDKLSDTWGKIKLSQ